MLGYFSRILLRLIQISIKIFMIMSKKKIIQLGLTVAKYIITLLLGALGSESGVIPPLGS